MARERDEEMDVGDLAVPERPGGRHAAVQDVAGVPAMPVIRPTEQYMGMPFPLIDGISPTVGWQFRLPAWAAPRS
jgi:hypothetical protein